MSSPQTKIDAVDKLCGILYGGRLLYFTFLPVVAGLVASSSLVFKRFLSGLKQKELRKVIDMCTTLLTMRCSGMWACVHSH